MNRDILARQPWRRRGWALRVLITAATAGLALILAACVSVGGKTSKADPTPAWVKVPPLDTATTYYGLGQAGDLPGARRNALRDIAAKIKVSIAGTVENRLAVHNDMVDRSALSRVTEEVQKTEFKNFTIVNTATTPDGVYALVSVDRQEFVRDTREKAQRLNNQIERATAGLDARPAIEQYMVLKRQRPRIVTAQGYFEIIGRKDLGPDDQAMLRKLDALMATADQVTQSLSFGLQAAPADKDVETAVATFLTGNGVRAQSGSSSGNASSAATVKVSATARQDTIQEARMVRLTVHLQVLDTGGQALAARDYVVSGSSLKDHESARQQAVLNLAAELRNNDLPGGLGFSFSN